MGLRVLFFSGFWIILFMPIAYAFPEEAAVLDRPVVEKKPQTPSWMDIIDSKKGSGVPRVQRAVPGTPGSISIDAYMRSRNRISVNPNSVIPKDNFLSQTEWNVFQDLAKNKPNTVVQSVFKIGGKAFIVLGIYSTATGVLTISSPSADAADITRGISGIIGNVPTNILAVQELGKLVTKTTPLLPKSAAVAAMKGASGRFAAKYAARFAFGLSVKNAGGMVLKKLVSLPAVVVSFGTDLVRQCADFAIEAGKMDDAITSIGVAVRSCPSFAAARVQAESARDAFDSLIGAVPDGPVKESLIRDVMEAQAVLASIINAQNECKKLYDQIADLEGARAWIIGWLKNTSYCPASFVPVS